MYLSKANRDDIAHLTLAVKVATRAQHKAEEGSEEWYANSAKADIAGWAINVLINVDRAHAIKMIRSYMGHNEYAQYVAKYFVREYV